MVAAPAAVAAASSAEYCAGEHVFHSARQTIALRNPRPFDACGAIGRAQRVERGRQTDREHECRDEDLEIRKARGLLAPRRGAMWNAELGFRRFHCTATRPVTAPMVTRRECRPLPTSTLRTSARRRTGRVHRGQPRASNTTSRASLHSRTRKPALLRRCARRASAARSESRRRTSRGGPGDRP